MSTRFVVKTGETFEYVLEFKDPDGAPVDMTDWTAKSQIRRMSDYSLVTDISTGWLDSTIGTLHIVALTSTMLWPVELLVWDIAIYDQQNRSVYTETHSIDVQRGVTI